MCYCEYFEYVVRWNNESSKWEQTTELYQPCSDRAIIKIDEKMMIF